MADSSICTMELDQILLIGRKMNTRDIDNKLTYCFLLIDYYHSKDEKILELLRDFWEEPKISLEKQLEIIGKYYEVYRI